MEVEDDGFTRTNEPKNVSKQSAGRNHFPRVPRATVALEFTVYDSSIRPDATPPGEIRFG